MRRTVGRALATLAMIGLAAGACSSTQDASTDTTASATKSQSGEITEYTVPAGSDGPQSGGSLVYGLEAETDGYSPIANRMAPAGQIVANTLFDPLAAWGADGKVYPYLAESFESSELFTEWKITLRPDVRFHDGTPADGAAVQKFLLALRDAPLTGAAAAPIEDVTLVEGEPLAAVVHLDQPWVVFPAVLTNQGGMLMAPSQLDAGPAGSRQPVGTGPFRFVDWVPDAKLNVVRNDDYWQDGLPYLDEIEFQPITDLQSRVNALETGSIDVLHMAQQQLRPKLTQLAEEGKIQLWFGTGEEDEALILLNNSTEPFNDVRLRKALAQATEHNEYFEATSTPPSRKADSFLSSDSPWYAADNGWPTYDLDAAKQLVDEWKAEHGGEAPAFVFRTTPAPEQQSVGQLLERQWEAAGFDVTLETMEQTQHIATGLSGNYQANLWRQFSSPDPDGEFHWWISTAIAGEGSTGLNFARLDDPQIDEALRTGRTNLDPVERKKAYADLQRRMSEIVPWVYLSHLQWMLAADLDVRDLTNTTLPDGTPAMPMVAGVHRMTQTWLES